MPQPIDPILEQWITAVVRLPKSLATVLMQHSAARPVSFLPATTVTQMTQSLGGDRVALGQALLPLATAFAEAPISDFKVGAVAFDGDGNAYLGANFEFADTHIAQTLHAEQSAIAHAWSRGAKCLQQLFINYAPCGHCRQFINEVKLADDFRIVLPESSPQPLDDYLPNAFGPKDLGIEQRILGETPPNYLSETPRGMTGDDALMRAASRACERSHAPYSGSYCGVAVQFADDIADIADIADGDSDIVTGRYAENAAFNPSLPPLQMALNYRRLQGQNWRNPRRVVMVERPARLSQQANTLALLEAVSGKTVIFDYFQA